MSYRVEKDVMVEMRDGETLATDLWLPEGGPAPTLVVRTPYAKDFPNLLANAIDVPRLVEAGYAVAWQDSRGTGRSGGVFAPMSDDAHDGNDTLAWLRTQPWSDGTIGTFGASALGWAQWATASESPAGLQAIAPTVTTSDHYTAPWYSDGGALSLHMSLWWSTLMGLFGAQRALAAGTGPPDTLLEVAGALDALPSRLAAMPTSDHPALVGPAPWFGQMLRHPDRDRFWQDLSISDQADQVTAPALNVGGWFDVFAGATTSTYTRMRREAGSAEARAGQRLVMGPWDHTGYTGAYFDRQFGSGADILAADLTGVHLAFFDRHLRGRTDALEGTAPVRIFVMGIDQWRDEQDWPLPDTRYTDFHLTGSGRAGTDAEDGGLSPDGPGENATDVFTYDPADPVPSRGGRLIAPGTLNAVGPVDQRDVEARDDVLLFTTPVLIEPLEVTGPISLVLHVASSALDTDVTGKLVDVFPDGRSIYLTDGIARMRYRNSLAAPELLAPGRVYEVTVDLSVTSNVFLPGHRVGLEISSSNFPRYDRNTNTGGVIAEESLDQAVVATNRVLHGPDHPSRLVLPLITR
ncbi:CocE/NonD family hydrolase [Blastococcus xanthinilyticus]|uniref:Xaa-Pro dipeptidyl-peptidase C-terminal domain-containing protein n=1 Tax=Blastococcus xanthinilyticus TaxID=1564164 RepID=A0A5S5D3A5_9ACTN|nr:CocE/NonD family hydrolase [Blastococcus xanthinilyticus]TYP90517.1 hypothetical protein BD833_101235 [Blastococcus xanthinilyticus]